MILICLLLFCSKCLYTFPMVVEPTCHQTDPGCSLLPQLGVLSMMHNFIHGYAANGKITCKGCIWVGNVCVRSRLTGACIINGSQITIFARMRACTSPFTNVCVSGDIANQENFQHCAMWIVGDSNNKFGVFQFISARPIVLKRISYYICLPPIVVITCVSPLFGSVRS